MEEEDEEEQVRKYLKPILRQISTCVPGANARLAKRVVAPYINIVRKGRKSILYKSTDRYNFYTTKKSNLLMKNLCAFLANSNDLPGLLYESVDVLKGLTKSLGARLYIVDKANNQLYQYQKNVMYPRCRVNYEIEMGKTVAAHVAFTKEYVMVPDVTADTRFSETIPYKDNVKAVLCSPIVTGSEVFAVVEYFREMSEPPYEKNDLKLIVLVCGWIGLAIQQNKDGVLLHKKQTINDDLMQLVLAYFGNSITMTSLLADILSYTKIQLKAEKGAIYVIEHKEDGMVADVYEEGFSDGDIPLIKRKLKIPFGKERTVACIAAQTKELMNVNDVYGDPRFNCEFSKDGTMLVINRTELCLPIISQDVLLGIITIINKKDGTWFTEEDEALIHIIGIYCSMALHYAETKKINKISNLELQETFESVNQIVIPHDESIRIYQLEYTIPKSLKEFDWYVLFDDQEKMPILVLHMMLDILGPENMDIEQMKMFIISVKKSYRHNYYHNFEHAFNVLHCMYCILLRNKKSFSILEMQALMIAALTHDIDHFGFTNGFIIVTNHFLSRLYEFSQMESHHYYLTTKILEVYNNLLPNMTKETYQLLLADIKFSILATDMVNYFKTRIQLIPLIAELQLDISKKEHKRHAIAIMMNACDLSGQCKPFSIAKRLTNALYKEFYHQGDIEKSFGVVPLTMMDRSNEPFIPDEQIQFLSIIVMPCTALLKAVFPNAEDLYTNSELTRDTWQRILDTKGDKIWRISDSLLQ